MKYNFLFKSAKIMSLIFYASERLLIGKSASRRLRIDKKIPCIIYSKNKLPKNIQIDNIPILYEKKLDNFYSKNKILVLNKKKLQVKIQSIQRHPYKLLIYHIDFIEIQ